MISVIILTKNEEKNILDCLEGLKAVGEIIVIDDYSEDRTIEVIKKFKSRKIKVFQHHLDLDFSEQRNFGLSKVKNEWVLFVDADERVSPDLLKEIEYSIKDTEKNGFLIKRTDIIWGKKIKFGESGNIKLLRLAKKNEGKWTGKVHEVWCIKGEVGELQNDLTHFPHQTIKEFLNEISFYSTIRAKELIVSSEQISLWKVIIYPTSKFVLNYFWKLGFVDGVPGLILATMMSLHSFLVRSKLWLAKTSQ